MDETEVAGAVYEFLLDCNRVILLCADNEEIERVALQLKRCLSQLTTPLAPLPFNANSLPALRNLALVKDMPIAKRFREFAHYLPWGFSPRTSDEGKEIAVCDFSQLFDFGALNLGLIYVDCHFEYPLHQHDPSELYFLISGTAKWRYGGGIDHESVTAGNVLHNRPNDWHGVIAGHTPVLALYVQWM